MPISSTQLSFFSVSFCIFCFLNFWMRCKRAKVLPPEYRDLCVHQSCPCPADTSDHHTTLYYGVRVVVTMDYVRYSLSFIIKVLFTLRLDLFLMFTYCTIFLYFISSLSLCHSIFKCMLDRLTAS